ncbi:cation transport ATPase [Fuscibacter oryzae]|uniref:Cation transport ATPase n=1 Tax=Fuscibacter oryzae TaxID=2803939 RepID=A0A8J7MPE9_9RHOB|nr:cation transport ATPase [Fuscibacter oryzae]MBL4927067.1 cation transport ATPase [Fuscibacter oryzae]
MTPPIPSLPRRARVAALLLTGLALAACQVAGSARQAPVLGGAVTMGLPAGYCIDRSTSREGADSAVIIMGRCNSDASAVPAIVTATVGRPGSAGVMTASPAELAAFFATTEGRATLSRDGKARDVRLISAVTSGNALLLHLVDRKQGEYWRAFVGARGRLVSISASGTPGIPLAPEAGRQVLDAFVAALATANATR